MRRLEIIQKSVREDIEKMHARLGTGLTTAELDAIGSFRSELEATSAAGKASSELLPRLRHAIANKVFASSLQALDQVIPQLAWEQVEATLPQTRGELPR